MKPIKAEASAGALIALLDTRSFVCADLYTFTLAAGGAPLRYTTADTDMGYWQGGASDTIWTHCGPLFDQQQSRAVGHWKTGLDTDTWHCTIAPRQIDVISGVHYPDKIGDVPWLAAALAGALDGAVVQVDRAYMPSWPPLPRGSHVVPTGVVNIFTGKVATVDIGRSAAIITINSHLELLDTQMPRSLYQAGCRHSLFDAGCTLSAAAYGRAGNVASGSSGAVIYATIANPAGSGTNTLGRVVMTTGKNAGFARSVRNWWTAGGNAAFQLLSPFPFLPQAGDQFVAYPGCDKQAATCAAFGNSANFGGMPYISPPETSV